jgi:methyl-accepting chemotaxis protein
MSRYVASGVVVLLAALLAAGCGGSSDTGSSGDTTPTAQWADSLCTSVSTYTSALQAAFDSLKSNGLTSESLAGAVDDAKSATETFTSSLDGLGRPDTEAGQQAQDAIDELSTEIQADMTKIEDTVSSAAGIAGVIAAVPTITSTVSDASKQIGDTVSTLRGLDAKGELQSAFDETDSCQSLTSSQ